MRVVIEGCDYFIRYLSLPGSIGGFIMPNNDGTYSMYLNIDHSPEMQMEDYIHEFQHILYDDLYDNKDIRDIEGLRRSA